MYLALGWFFLVLGIIGIVVPLLPTTPFLLLTAICFSKGSEKTHYWLLNHKIFGPPINDWNRSGVIQTKHKLMATIMMLISSVFVYPKDYIPLVGKIGFTISFACLMLFIWTRPSK